VSLHIIIGATRVYDAEAHARQLLVAQQWRGTQLPQVASVDSAHIQRHCECGEMFWAPMGGGIHECESCRRPKPKRRKKETGFLHEELA
jgi:hypothetical protein